MATKSLGFSCTVTNAVAVLELLPWVTVRVTVTGLPTSLQVKVFLSRLIKMKPELLQPFPEPLSICPGLMVACPFGNIFGYSSKVADIILNRHHGGCHI